jgi:hypothetical protein
MADLKMYIAKLLRTDPVKTRKKSETKRNWQAVSVDGLMVFIAYQYFIGAQ